MTLDRAISISDLRRLARTRLPRMAFDFIAGGCDDELGLAENEAAFNRYRLLPRYLVDVSRRDLTAAALDQEFSMPLGIAPTGNAGMFRHDADRLLAAEAEAANVPFILSGASNAPLEEVMKVAPKHTWFQLYATRDSMKSEDMIRLAADLGVHALVLSVDVPVHSNRERNARNRFAHPLKVTPSMMLQAAMHPRWTLDYFRHGGLPYMGNFRRYAPAGASPAEVADLFVSEFPAPHLTWAFVERARRLWPRKLVLKGVLHAGDAAMAVDSGVDGLIVSNHGGRQLDRAPAALDAFISVKDAVGDKAELMLDGGILRGSDIAIALCLGARFVFVGRSTLYGAVVGGRAGIKKALGIYRRELDIILGQLGCPRSRNLGPEFLMTAPTDSRPFP